MPSLMTPNLLSELRRIAALPLEESYALPPQVFTDEGFAALEDERIFKHAWQCVGRADELLQASLTKEFGLKPEALGVFTADAGNEDAPRVLPASCSDASPKPHAEQ